MTSCDSIAEANPFYVLSPIIERLMVRRLNSSFQSAEDADIQAIIDLYCLWRDNTTQD